jgi:prophage tail gpP-like protein
MMNADATTDEPLAEFDKQVQIALDPFGNTLYLTKVMKDQADNQVYKFSISDKETSTAFEDELCKTLTYIDYDAITGKLIWTGLSNEGNDVVRAGDKTGSNKTTLFSRNIETRKTPFSSFAFRTILKSE